jgi:cytochrome c oxidase assembly protein subunit 15
LPTQQFGVAARLSFATALLTLALIVLGSVVRTTGSGLACPDWPLCHGHLIPPLQFNILIEWLHRLMALLVSLCALGTAGWILVRRELRARLGGFVLLAATLLLVQVLLGALTVWKLLSPAVVSSHLAVALLFFTTLITMGLTARAHAGRGVSESTRPAALLAVFAFTTGLTYVQAVLGGVVSTSHAGLACPDWPACNGVWLPPLDSLQGLQMLHRYVAYALVVAVIFAATRARRAPDPGVRAGAGIALGLVLGQVVLGVTNVLLGTPVWLSALHLAVATALLGTNVIVTWRVASMPAMERRLATAAGA